MKHPVSSSDPEHASHLHTEGSSVLGFFVCAEEFRGAFLLSGSPVIKVFLFMRWDMLCWCTFGCSGGRNWIFCMFLGLKFEESQDRVHWEMLVPLCMKTVGRQGESFDIQRISTKENIHPFFLGWIFNSPGVFLGYSMSSEVLTRYREICTSYLQL